MQVKYGIAYQDNRWEEKAYRNMWWSKTTKLSPKQETLIPVMRERWGAITVSTEPVNREKTSLAVKAAYKLIGKDEPEIVFFDSPYQALVTTLGQLVQQLDNELVSRIESQLNSQLTNQLESELVRQLISQLAIPLEKQLEKQLGNQLGNQLENRLKNLLESQLESQLKSQLEGQLESQVENQRLSQLASQHESQLNSKLAGRLVNQLKNRIKSQQTNKLLSRLESLLFSQGSSQLVSRLGNLIGRPLFYNNCIRPELWASQGTLLDFWISVLNGAHNQKAWQVFQSLVSNCGWIFPYEKVCIVCDRPIKLSFDSKNLLHADGEFALLFTDGYGLYFNHGVVLPKKYGQLHPRQWQAEWIVEEDNAELRRVLLQGIGYTRICRELQAIELDAWQEYSLLKIDKIVDDIDGQPISLLKMICPSTGFTHILRVPPDIQSAREAIRWVNWGVDPERFALQS